MAQQCVPDNQGHSNNMIALLTPTGNTWGNLGTIPPEVMAFIGNSRGSAQLFSLSKCDMARFTAESLAASFPLPPPFSAPPTNNTTTTSTRSSSTASNAPGDPRVECLTRVLLGMMHPQQSLRMSAAQAITTITPLSHATILTRDQMAALAAGIHPRCGSRGALLAIMGPHHAHHLVRDLVWSGLVLPTLALFLVDVAASESAFSIGSTRVLLSFVLSPVLLSVFRAPTRAPHDGPSGGQWFGPRHAAHLDFVGGLRVEDLVSRTIVTVRPPSTHRGPPARRWAANSKWGVSLTSVYSSSHNDDDDGDWGWCVTVGVASTSGVIAVASRSAVGSEEIESSDGESGTFVFVTMKVLSNAVVNVHMDHAVDSEAIITEVTAKSAVMSVVDLEQTYKSRSLVVVSTTTWPLPVGHWFLDSVVMRRRRKSSDGASPRRVFIVKTLCNETSCALFRVDEQQTGPSEYNLITLPGGHDEVDVYPVTQSLFWYVSFDSCDPQKKSVYTVCDCDDVEHPVLVEDLCSSDHGWMAAEGGFLFGVGSNGIEVLEPTSGGVVLTIKFPGFSCLDLMNRPFSCCLSTEKP
ncbi:hypothetical protein Pelo_18666 [Pelomyxa schiedti]|nr:hypothetical protein Pelo_18666 [Pelomyxa schiedti]